LPRNTLGAKGATVLVPSVFDLTIAVTSARLAGIFGDSHRDGPRIRTLRVISRNVVKAGGEDEYFYETLRYLSFRWRRFVNTLPANPSTASTRGA
jgi:hypothetical protein